MVSATAGVVIEQHEGESAEGTILGRRFTLNLFFGTIFVQITFWIADPSS